MECQCRMYFLRIKSMKSTFIFKSLCIIYLYSQILTAIACQVVKKLSGQISNLKFKYHLKSNAIVSNILVNPFFDLSDMFHFHCSDVWFWFVLLYSVIFSPISFLSVFRVQPSILLLSFSNWFKGIIAWMSLYIYGQFPVSVVKIMPWFFSEKPIAIQCLETIWAYRDQPDVIRYQNPHRKILEGKFISTVQLKHKRFIHASLWLLPFCKGCNSVEEHRIWIQSIQGS